MHTKRQYICAPLVRDDRAKRLCDMHGKSIPPFDTYTRDCRIGYGYLVAKEGRSISNKAAKVERVCVPIIFDFRLSSHVPQLSSISPRRVAGAALIQKVCRSKARDRYTAFKTILSISSYKTVHRKRAFSQVRG